MPSTCSDGPAPMEIDRVDERNYKGMGKEKGGKDSQKGNYKNWKDGNSWSSESKGQGKNHGGGKFGKVQETKAKERGKENPRIHPLLGNHQAKVLGRSRMTRARSVENVVIVPRSVDEREE